jgi:putative transposase
MTNHFHVVVETKEPNLSKGMAWLNGNFTRMFNKTYNRVGHVFQGRYHAVLVQKQDYLLELARYVVLNPVRAGIVRNAHDWPWSSYQATLGQAPAPDWLNTQWTLKLFSNDPPQARERYEKFVAAGIHEPSVWEARSGNFLGGEAWLREVSGTVSGTVPDTLVLET